MTEPKQPSRLAAAVRGDREETPYQRFRRRLGLLAPDIAKVMGSKERADKFVRVALNAVQANPDVLTADERSLFLACMEAAQDGLMPDGREAVFNIYRTKNKEESKRQNRDVWEDVVQYMPMVYGLIQLIYEAGATYVDAVAVYEADRPKFRYLRGDEPKIEHEPSDADNPGKVIAAYVVIKMRTGETKREVMFRRDIERVRAKSKAPNGLMWDEEKGFYDQGAIKSVIHRVFKQLPAARETERLERALRHDNAAAGLAEVTPGSESVAETTELAALIDGRLEADMRKVPTPPAKEPVQTGEAGAGERIPHGAGAGAPSGRGGTHPPEDKEEKAPPAKIGDPGTPELKQKILDTIKASSDVAFVWAQRDLADMYKWENPADLAEINAAARARAAELEPG